MRFSIIYNETGIRLVTRDYWNDTGNGMMKTVKFVIQTPDPGSFWTFEVREAQEKTSIGTGEKFPLREIGNIVGMEGDPFSGSPPKPGTKAISGYGTSSAMARHGEEPLEC